MKPIKLKIKGINSYVTEQTIDFEKLSENNLFGVFGETGSGKTTILDSIVMALYGTSDRDIIQNTINVNVKNAYIVFTFEFFEDNLSYMLQVKREYKLRPSGLKTSAYLKDIYGNKILCEGSDNVTDEIIKILGIDKKEFLRCIALPQGEFDRFLLDTPLNRRKTIAKFFNLEMFGEKLLDKLKNRKEKLSLEKLKVEGKLSQLGNVSEQIIKNLKDNIKKLETNKINNNFLLNKLKTQFGEQAEISKAKINLAELQAQLTIKENEKNEILFYKEQVEFSERYGNNLLIGQKIINCQNEIANLTNQALNLKEKINNITTAEKKLNTKKQNLENENAEMQNKLKIATKEQLLQTDNLKLIEENRIKVDKITNDINDNNSLIIKLNRNVSDNTISISDNYSLIENINLEIEKKKQQLNRIYSCVSIKDKSSFLNKLNELKNTIDPKHIEEVRDYKIAADIKKLNQKFLQFEISEREGVSNLTKILDENNVLLEDINKAIKNIDLDIYQLLNNINDIKANISKLEVEISYHNQEIEKLENENFIKFNEKEKLIKQTKQLSAENSKLNHIGEIEKYKRYFAVNLKTIATLESELKNISVDLHKNIVSLEVCSSNLSNFKQNLVELKQLFGLNKLNKGLIDETNNLLIDSEQIPQLKNKIEEFYSEYNYLQKSIENLTIKYGDKEVDKGNFDRLQNKIKNLEYILDKSNTNLILYKNQLGFQINNLQTANKFKTLLNNFKKDLENLNSLQKLFKDDSLLEYVSEKYMQLVTQFANKFVYSISKGKYMLKYDKDFFVLDNFNGGIERGVKTLSGGERFIISLSIALGMSQSIATSKRRNFKFFFIDEGFGSLSDNYLEKVLQSFDALIKLDFTVGFISHVEKMQNYLSNKVIVTKPSIEVGSKVTQY